MLFEATHGGTRIVDVYERTVSYKFEDGHAYRVTASGSVHPLPLHVAQAEIERFRERDGRAYKHDVAVTKRDYLWAGIALLAVTLAAAAWVLLA